MDRSQLLKGILEGCIMKIIEKKEIYGYEIVIHLQDSGFPEVKEGTLYPLLLRLEKKGQIQAVYRASPLGPNRKYYHLTEEGKTYLKEFWEAWGDICDSVTRIFGEESV